jgi:hypothetical protein
MAVQARDIEVADGAHVVKFYEHGAELGRECQFAPFGVDPDSPGRARRLVVDTLRRWGATSRLVNDAALLVSELATNAVRHADSSFSVTVRASGSTLRVAVHDGAPLAGTLSAAWLIPQPLHGLSLVDALCTRWGVEDTRHGKLVWVELPYEGTVVPGARN